VVKPLVWLGSKRERKRKRARQSLILSGTATAIATAACLIFRPDRALRVTTGIISHTLCSAAFVSGLDPDQVFAETVPPGAVVQLMRWALRYRFDRHNRQVFATMAGGFESRAVFREGLGCLVLRGNRALPPAPPRGSVPPPASLVDDVLEPELVNPAEKVQALVDRIFTNPDHRISGSVKAVVVMRAGQVVAERYVKGIGNRTPIHGWSVTKSVINALVGILVRQGRLSVQQSAPVAEWSDAGDPRHSISIDQLLRMTSGLDIDETLSPFDAVSRMLFLEPDMAAFAARAPLRTTPGTRWNYTSANTLILSRIIRETVEKHGTAVLEFAWRELFEPLGMTTVTLELDETGTPVGSTYMFASARDWARFGMLYVNDGVVGGRRILPEGWVRYSSSPSLDSGYGAGFWIGISRNKDRRLPADSIAASGHLGQEVMVLPSERLVVARFGVIHKGKEQLDNLIGDVIAALGSSAR
jgi:hypothetical protein